MLQATAVEAVAGRERVSRELEAAKEALKEQFKEMQNAQDAAMAAQQQARTSLPLHSLTPNVSSYQAFIAFPGPL